MTVQAVPVLSYPNFAFFVCFQFKILYRYQCDHRYHDIFAFSFLFQYFVTRCFLFKPLYNLELELDYLLLLVTAPFSTLETFLHVASFILFSLYFIFPFYFTNKKIRKIVGKNLPKTLFYLQIVERLSTVSWVGSNALKWKNWDKW